MSLVIICPHNDAEAIAIQEYCRANADKVKLINTEQTEWGVSWESLNENKEVMKELEVAFNNHDEVYGVEFSGEPIIALNDKLYKCNVIDHHNEYAGRPSSLEQVAQLVGVPLSEKEEFIAACDSNYTTGILDLAKRKGYTEEETQKILSETLAINRASQKQYLSNDEIQKMEDIADIVCGQIGKELSTNSYDLIVLKNHDNSWCNPITDRLFAMGYTGDTLICTSIDNYSGVGEVNFFGNPDVCEGMYKTEDDGNWRGATYWGKWNASDHNSIQNEIINIGEYKNVLVIDSNECVNSANNTASASNDGGIEI